MKQIRIILVTLLLILTAQAEWKPLKTLDYYGPKAFTLKKGVAYVEIRKYKKVSEAGTDIVEQDVAFKMYRHPLSYFGPALKRTFQSIPPKKEYAFKKAQSGGLVSRVSWYHNGFMIDSRGKQWRLESIRDVIDMVKPIDTPADLSLVLWLHSDAQERSDREEYRAKYRKSDNGYVIREHHISREYGEWIYGCGDYTFEYRINRSGGVSQRKLIEKREVACGGE